MPPTLSSLVQNGALGLIVRAGHGLLDRPVTWVHVSELTDPAPYLEGGELLLTLGLQLADKPVSLPHYVQRLADAGVSALGVGTGFAFHSVPPALVDAGEELGMPVLEIPRPTPFIAIAKALVASLLAEASTATAAVVQAQQRLTRALRAGDPHTGVLDQLAQEVSGWALLTDGDARPVHATVPLSTDIARGLAEAIDRIRARGPHTSASFTIGGAEIVVQALGADDGVKAFLAVGVPRAFTDPERTVANIAASLLTLVFEQASNQDAKRQQFATVVYELVRSYGHQAAEPLARLLGLELPAEPIRVAIVTAPPRELADVAAAVRLQAVPVLIGQCPELAEPHLALLTASDIDLPGLLQGVIGGLRACAAGVSAETALPDIATAEREAVSAMRRSRQTGSITVFDDLARHGLLAMLGPASYDVARAMLLPLLEYDERQAGNLVATVRAWLNHHGHWQLTADSLGIHRHTLRYRMQAAERLLGRSFNSAQIRMEILLAIEVYDHWSRPRLSGLTDR